MKGIFFKDIEKPRRLMVIISEANLNTHVCEWMCGRGRCVCCVCVCTHMHRHEYLILCIYFSCVYVSPILFKD